MCEGSIFHFRARQGESRDTIIIPEGESESSRRRRERSERKKEEMEDEIRTNCKKNEEQKERKGGMVTRKMKRGVNDSLPFSQTIHLSPLQSSGLSESNSSQAEFEAQNRPEDWWKLQNSPDFSGVLTSFRGGLRHSQTLWSVYSHLFLDRSLISTDTFMSGKSKYILLNASRKRLQLKISLHKLHLW